MYPGNASPSVLTAGQEFAQVSGLLAAKGTKITKTTVTQSAVTYDFGNVTSSPDYLGSEELNLAAATYDFGDVATSPNYLDSEQLKPAAKYYLGSESKPAELEESPYFTLSAMPIGETTRLPSADSTSDADGGNPLIFFLAVRQS